MFFIIQLPFITQPPIDSSHTWRQTLTATVARNQANGEGTMCYPRIDHNGASSGIIGMEFPVYNAAIAGMIKAFGFTHWYGRLINLLVSLLGVFCFTRLVEAISDKKTAFWSGIFLLCSIWLIFMRKIMPDTFSVSLVLTGLWLGWRFYLFGKWYDALGYFILISLGLLSKLPASLILAPFGMTLYVKEFSWSKKAVIVALTYIGVSLTAIWYFVWVPYLVATYEYPLYFTRDLATGFIELSFETSLILQQFVFHSFYSFAAFGLFVTGIFLAARNKQHKLLIVFIVSVSVFMFFMIKTGMVFPKHNYYMVPVIPVMAMMLGYTITHFPARRVRPYLVAVVLIESLANMHHDVRPKKAWYTGIERELDKVSDRTQLVVCNGGVGPQMMYFMNRKGWTYRTENITPELINACKAQGAKWLVLQYEDETPLPVTGLTSVYSDRNFSIYALNHTIIR